jgi:hypothetical protein
MLAATLPPPPTAARVLFGSCGLAADPADVTQSGGSPANPRGTT